MQGFNVIAVYNSECSEILMCKRKKEPYLGLLNLTGGKIDDGEDGLDAAYRELYEETGVTRDDITLTYLMRFSYPRSDCYVEAYVGRLREPVDVHGDENELLWVSLDNNFFDMSVFAGEGNIGHILEIVNLEKESLLI